MQHVTNAASVAGSPMPIPTPRAILSARLRPSLGLSSRDPLVGDGAIVVLDDIVIVFGAGFEATDVCLVIVV